MYSCLLPVPMDHNLVSSFIRRETGFEVNEQLKIKASEPMKNYHLIFEPELDVRIYLQLRGAFSVFPVRALDSVEISYCDSFDMIYLSPNVDHWNPHTEAWAEQEYTMCWERCCSVDLEVYLGTYIHT